MGYNGRVVPPLQCNGWGAPRQSEILQSAYLPKQGAAVRTSSSCGECRRSLLYYSSCIHSIRADGRSVYHGRRGYKYQVWPSPRPEPLFPIPTHTIFCSIPRILGLTRFPEQCPNTSPTCESSLYPQRCFHFKYTCIKYSYIPGIRFENITNCDRIYH